jgi:uncharacterized protein YjbK
MLTKNEYLAFLNHNQVNQTIQFTQHYLYFNQEKGELVRVRITENTAELTKKTRVSKNQNIEVNLPISLEQAQELIKKPDLILEHWPDLVFAKIMTNTFAATNRKVFTNDNYEIMLDQTTFANGDVDYEIEVEFKTSVGIEQLFNQILLDNEIVLKQSITKIQRTISRRNNGK